MTQYVGCERARPLLDGLIDGELSMAEQLAVESHLRWCDTCALRVSDMRTIGASLRSRSTIRPVVDAEDDTLTAITEGVFVRVRAERAQSFLSRMHEMLTDRRLLWPALGATAAVLLCVAAGSSVLRASVSRNPESLAALATAIGSPGSITRPLRPADNGVTIPRLSLDEAERASVALERMPEEDVIYTVRTVVGRVGSVADPMLLSDEASADSKAERAVLNSVRKTRFMPAQTPMGQAVAVDVVWVIAKTTAVAPFLPEPFRFPSVDIKLKYSVKPPVRVPSSTPLSGQPAARPSATA